MFKLNWVQTQITNYRKLLFCNKKLTFQIQLEAHDILDIDYDLTNGDVNYESRIYKIFLYNSKGKSKLW